MVKLNGVRALRKRYKELLGKFIFKQNVLLNLMCFLKRIYPLPYYCGHYFDDTPATMSHWHFLVLTVFGYSRSQIRLRIDFKVRLRALNNRYCTL